MGHVSRALLQRAGPELQKEAKQNSDAIEAGKLVVTKGYGLSCKHVVHGVIPGAYLGIDKVQKFTFACLKKAAALKCRSVAFPALGTGNYGYNPEDVAKAMFAAVDDFDTKCKDSGLEEVHFVLYHKDAKIIQAFEKRMKQGAYTAIENRQTSGRVEANYKKFICDERGLNERASFYCENCKKDFCGTCNDKQFHSFHVVVYGVERGLEQGRQDSKAKAGCSNNVSSAEVAANEYRLGNSIDEDRIPLIAGGSTERMQPSMYCRASDAEKGDAMRYTSFEGHLSVNRCYFLWKMTKTH